MEEEEKQKIFHELVEKYFIQCDRFLIERWKIDNEPLANLIPEKIRQEAYHHFYEVAAKQNIASRPTIQRWFGIRGHSMPKREQIFHLAFVCGFTVDETREYLQYAISEPDFQVNDYHEMIALYGLDNHMSYEEYEDMVEYFEQYSDWSIPIRQTAHTDEIMRRYEPVRHLKPKDFLLWVRRNEELFKGYSMTTYRNFMNLVEEALNLFREEIRELLFLTLEDTGFFQWAEENHVAESEYGKEIRHFLKNKKRRKNNPISKEKIEEIEQLTAMAYSPLRRVCDLLSEIYSGIQISNTNLDKSIQKELRQEIGYVDAKYISEIISISSQKEKEMHLLQAYTKCRKGILNKVDEKYLQRQMKQQRQRTHNIRRPDLLLLIQYVTQKRYLREIQKNGQVYEEKDAKDLFIETADTILNICGMRPMNEKYRLDYLLLKCFGADDIYYLSDILE